MSKPLKGLNVLSKHDPDIFNKILGHKEYKIAIEKADGDAEKLKIFFGMIWQMIIIGNLLKGK